MTKIIKIVNNIVTKALEKGEASVNGRPSYAFGKKGHYRKNTVLLKKVTRSASTIGERKH